MDCNVGSSERPAAGRVQSARTDVELDKDDWRQARVQLYPKDKAL